jgi:hypothetical protein
MPKRTEEKGKAQTVKKSAAKVHTHTYEELLVRIRKHIDETYGGVAALIAHKDFTRKCKFESSEATHSKIYVYLSLPQNGEGAKVKSFPVLQKLYKGLLGIELKNKIQVMRSQIITSETGIE